MRRHTDREFEAELQSLRDGLLGMAGRVEAMIAASVEALVERNVELAHETIAADNVVNQAEVDNDGLCLQILAKRQPMASDLRFITLVLKMVTDLERIADLAVNICERAIDLNDVPQLKPYVDMPKMALVVRSMLHDAIEAFINSDSSAAREVIARDDQVDEYYHVIFRDLLEIMTKDPGAVQPGIHIQSVAKYLERIADHCTNLAEQVIFMVKGKDIRHEGKLPDDGSG